MIRAWRHRRATGHFTKVNRSMIGTWRDCLSCEWDDRLPWDCDYQFNQRTWDGVE